MKGLTDNQIALLERIKAAPGGLLTVTQHGSYITKPYSEEDGRTVSALIARGALVCECREGLLGMTGIYALADRCSCGDHFALPNDDLCNWCRLLDNE